MDDTVVMELNVPFRYVRSNPRVRHNIGKVSLMKGPVVYCLEEADNGKYLSGAVVDTSVEPQEEFDHQLLRGTLCARLQGSRIDYEKAGDLLYGEERPVYKKAELKAIPYFCWNNRGEGEMTVWMRERE